MDELQKLIDRANKDKQTIWDVAHLIDGDLQIFYDKVVRVNQLKN